MDSKITKKPSATLTVNNKQLELPVYGGTVGPDVIDIRKLYSDGKVFTYDPGFTSTAACESQITYIDGDEGVLLYRGYPIDQLAEKSSFLEVCYLLANGELPNEVEFKRFERDITYHTMLHAQFDRFERVVGAGRMKTAARRQRPGERDLISADKSGQQAAGPLRGRPHRSPGPQHHAAPGEQLAPELVEARGVGFAPRPDHQVPRGLMGLQLEPPELLEPPAETIAGHRGRLKSGDDQPHPRMARHVVGPDHVEMLEPATPAPGEAAANVGRAGEPASSRQARRRRQEPPCFEGRETTSCLRPFLRRRESTARPHRVAIRARNPCLLIRRLLRGL